MGLKSQKKGAAGERELADCLRRAGYPVSWGGNRTFGCTPDLSGLPGIHIECKRVEALNVTRAMEQAERDADRFRDGAPAVFHRRNQKPWLVTMLLEDWLRLYSSSNPTPEIPGYSDRNAHARFFTYDPTTALEKGDNMSTWKTETPVTADTGRNVLEYFKDSGQLSNSIKNQFGMDAETYQQAWSIYQNDDLKADQKRQQLSALGYNGSALYKALGQNLG